MNNFELFEQNPYEFIAYASVEELIQLADEASESYYNSGVSIMSDSDYDLIVERIETLDPYNSFFNKVGQNVKDEKAKVDLPFIMGSMTKPSLPKLAKFIDSFKRKYNSTYIISDKLDGVSALLELNTNGKHRLLTRGNGTVGVDVSNLIKHINFGTTITNKKFSEQTFIRGEIIIKKETFNEKYTDDKANARNMVSGIVNSKTLKIREARDTDFIAYEMTSPWMNYKKQMKELKKLGINRVSHTFHDSFTSNALKDILRDRKENSPYECDGIIISSNDPSSRSDDYYPDYSFAYKNIDDLERITVTVTDIAWQISKDGYIKPVLKFKPTKLSGVKISSTSAFNALYVEA